MDQLKDYIRALGYLQGAIKIEHIIATYEEQTGKTADAALVAELVKNGDIQNLYYEDGWITYDFLLSDDEFEKLKILKQWYPLWIPQQEVLMNYTEESYLEWIPQALALQDYLTRFYPDEEGSAEQISMLIEDVMTAIKIECNVAYVRSMLSLIGKVPEKIDQSEEIQLMELIKDFVLHSRAWHTNGFTLAEFRKIQERYGPSPKYSGSLEYKETSIPLGRNDPCPCGSGKKYKKCCMRKEITENPSEGPLEGEFKDGEGLDGNL